MSRRSDPLTATELRAYLERNADFALELEIYRAALGAGLRASHGGTYEDPITKKPRQYDIRVSSEAGPFRIAASIECKNLRDSAPLLICRIPRSEDESFHDLICSHDPNDEDPFASSLLRPGYETLSIRAGRSVYRCGELVGKSTLQVRRQDNGDLTSGDGEIFEKWSQALASAADLIAFAQHANEGGYDAIFTWVVPFLVVSDGALWVADFSPTGEIEGDPRQMDEVTLFVGREYSPLTGDFCTLAHLHICTRSSMPKVFARLSARSDFWRQVFPSEFYDTLPDDTEAATILTKVNERSTHRRREPGCT